MGCTREYLVKWKEYDASHNIWEHPQQFDDLGVIEDYWKRRGEDVQVKEKKKPKRKRRKERRIQSGRG